MEAMSRIVIKWIPCEAKNRGGAKSPLSQRCTALSAKAGRYGTPGVAKGAILKLRPIFANHKCEQWVDSFPHLLSLVPILLDVVDRRSTRRTASERLGKRS